MKTFTLYIMRHGLAGQFGDYTDDSQRPLTDEGRRKTAQVAQKLPRLDVKIDLILTSPYRRAAETAEIVHRSYPQATVESAPYLQPGGNFEQLLDRLNTLEHPCCPVIVGHEPSLSAAAERLIWGEVRSSLVLKKTGIIRLDAPATGHLLGNCQLRWLLPAKVLLA